MSQTSIPQLSLISCESVASAVYAARQVDLPKHPRRIAETDTDQHDCEQRRSGCWSDES